MMAQHPGDIGGWDVPDAELNAITDRIAVFEQVLTQACADAGRNRESVRLVAVAKNHPASYAAHAIACGLLDLGENKAQELAAKRTELAAAKPAEAAGARWHFIGRLQRNKAKQVVEYADIIHSIDRAAVAEAVAKAAQRSERFSEASPLPVLLQVDLDPALTPGEHDSTAARGGVHPDDLLALADAASASGVLAVRGVMAIAPLDHDAGECFARLAQASERLRAQFPDATEISAGMSADFPVAIANGATIVRVGTALFGPRRLTSDA